MFLKICRSILLCIAFFFATNGMEMQGQETRTESISQQQQAKTLAPELPSRVEQVIKKIQDGGWFISPTPRGFYPYFDSVYPGGGFTLGAGYRRYYGDYTFAEIRGLYSFLNYKLLEVRTVSSNHAGGLISLDANLRWRDATQVPYYGLGPGTPQADHTSFGVTETDAGGGITIRPIKWFHVRTGVGYEGYQEKSGAGSYPSIEDKFDQNTAPGLGSDPAYVHTQASAAVLWQEAEGYSRKGGLYRYTFNDFRNIRGNLDNFQMTRGEMVQHIPILRETWVLSLRARVESVLGNSTVAPYFLLPFLGSGSTLRGYGTGRFRDRNSLLMTGEWRWIPNRMGVDLAFFYDAGKVAPRFSDLGFSHLKSDAGVGIRFHGPGVTVLRVDLARGNEGWNLVFSASAPF